MELAGAAEVEPLPSADGLAQMVGLASAVGFAENWLPDSEADGEASRPEADVARWFVAHL